MQSDTLGALTAIDVNLTLGLWDRFLTRLRLYLAPWHLGTCNILTLCQNPWCQCFRKLLWHHVRMLLTNPLARSLTWDCRKVGSPPPTAPRRPGGRSAVLHGDMDPVQQAVIHLGTRIFPDRENLATLEMVPVGTTTPVMATITGAGAPPEMPQPDDLPMEAESLLDPLPGLPLTDLLSCADQHPVGGGVPVFILTGLAGDNIQ